MDGRLNSPVRSELPRGYRVHRHLGVVYDDVPPGAQDLTAIQGVNTRNAVALNRLGIYTWAQIALWSHHEVAAVAQELQLSPVQIMEQQWVEQARRLGEPAPTLHFTDHLPASWLRTAGLLACAMLFGFLMVSLLSRRGMPPLQGVLSAEITSLRVPVASRLVTAHVEPGDEVYSGEVLLTLEKLRHLEVIEQQQLEVRRLEQQLKHAEARARLDIDLQSSEIDRQLFELRTRMTEAETGAPETVRVANPVADTTPPAAAVRHRQVSASRTAESESANEAVAPGILFFNGPSGPDSELIGEMFRPRKAASVPSEVPQRTAEAPGRDSARDSARDSTRSTEARTASAAATTAAIASRIRRLEELQDLLPERIRMAAGLDQLKLQLEEEVCVLSEMQAASREIPVVAPAYGVVGQLRCRVGDSLQPGDVLVKVLHTERRFVVVRVPTDQIGSLQAGSRVRLGFPDSHRYTGVVSDVPLMATESHTADGRSVATVRVEPAGRLWPQLPIGSHVEVVLDN